MIKPGAYRAPLIEAFKSVKPELAEMLANRTIVLAFTASLVGNGRIYHELKEPFIQALESKREEYPEEAETYINNLNSGKTVIIDTRTTPGDKVWAPGELFFAT